ncbi:MAG: DUF433 domain-containing protein [Planctomycetota bacterium]|nr:DUF433 domain-containing protein [Planctomycetota bacterium]
MSLHIELEAVPLESDTDGVVRVVKTRVTLDTIVYAFQEGLSAEEISEQYPAVPLGIVYSTIGYYLTHQSLVQSYLESREDAAQTTRVRNETRVSLPGILARLLARRQKSG